MKTVYADIYRKYIKLYETKPSLTEGHEVREVIIPENPDGTGRVYVGLSIAEAEGQWGVGITTSLSLDRIREQSGLAERAAIASLESKLGKEAENIKCKSCEYFISPVPEEKKNV